MQPINSFNCQNAKNTKLLHRYVTAPADLRKIERTQVGTPGRLPQVFGFLTSDQLALLMVPLGNN
jgi:hypothetical protein